MLDAVLLLIVVCGLGGAATCIIGLVREHQSRNPAFDHPSYPVTPDVKLDDERTEQTHKNQTHRGGNRIHD